MIRPWIEAMRLRTLPVSIAGVITAAGFALADDCFRPLPALLCLLFAVLAQIASNFANEYYDYRDGLDRPGREGPRRGVTEGDITPRAMKLATYLVLALACAIGLSLIAWGGWWLLPVGIIIALGAIAYSAGPFPLSRRGLGEIAVLFFFGVIPVNLTYYIMAGQFTSNVLLGSIAIGLMGANVLLVNNYRDADEDEAVGKYTSVVLFGRRTAMIIYLINGIIAAALMYPATPTLITLLYIAAHGMLWNFMRTHRGAALNPILGMTAMLMFLYSVAFALSA